MLTAQLQENKDTYVYTPEDKQTIRFIFDIIKHQYRNPLKSYDFAESEFKSEEVKHYFRIHPSQFRKMGNDANEDAINLLERMLAKTNGMLDVECFFAALAQEKTHSEQENKSDDAIINKNRFALIIKEIFIPYFSQPFKVELVEAAKALGHGMAASYGSLPSAASATVSAGKVTHSLFTRVKERTKPSLDIIEKTLPLLQPMHDMAQQTLDIFHLMHNRPLEKLRVPDMEVLTLALGDCQEDKSKKRVWAPRSQPVTSSSMFSV